MFAPKPDPIIIKKTTPNLTKLSGALIVEAFTIAMVRAVLDAKKREKSTTKIIFSHFLLKSDFSLRRHQDMSLTSR